MLYNAQQFLRSLIAPSLCAYCKIFIDKQLLFCIDCSDMIKPIASVNLPVTANYSINVLAISAYQEPLKSLILSKKFSNICASAVLGELIWQHTHIRHIPVDYFIPIPLHWTRYAHRGFNQADEIAKIVAKHNGKPVVVMLKRSKRTQFQYGLTSQDRNNNLKNAFELSVKRPQDYYQKHLVIVDDLMTTGSTLREAAQELRKLKPASITALVACRVV